MKPCSAYCRPDEGIHAYMDWLPPIDADPKERAGWVGQIATVGHGPRGCVPPGKSVRILAMELAPEAPPSPFPEFPIVALATVQVLSTPDRKEDHAHRSDIDAH